MREKYSEFELKPENKKTLEQVEIEIKYEGYISRQYEHIQGFNQNENIKIPANFPYYKIKSLSTEAIDPSSAISGSRAAVAAVLCEYRDHCSLGRPDDGPLRESGILYPYGCDDDRGGRDDYLPSPHNSTAQLSDETSTHRSYGLWKLGYSSFDDHTQVTIFS